MARIINAGDTPAKKRHAHMRSCAEVLRLLAQRPQFDAESRDMTAFFVFNLRGISETIDESAQVWDEKNYWKKAEELRAKWRWSRNAAAELEKLIRADRWLEVPPFLVTLIPHFSEITITEITRDSDWWVGALRSLHREKAGG